MKKDILISKIKMAFSSFTITPKIWIEQTNAIDLMLSQGKSGDTYAHPIISISGKYLPGQAVAIKSL